jgi:hypothetical protein
MRAWAAVLLGLLGLSAGSALRADVSGARTLIGRCAKTADANFRGLDGLHDVCPGLEQALEQLDIGPYLPANWRAEISARALGDFVALDVRYTDPALWGRVRPDAHRLRSIALTLQSAAVPISWWERLTAWVRRWLERAGREQPGWLRFLPGLQLGPGMVRIVFIALATLVVAAAATVVSLEIRAARSPAGLRSRLRARRSSADATPIAKGSPDLAGLADLDSAAARDRPILLLRALVEALTRANRLRHDRDLTCRELVAQARFDSVRQRDDFGHVALLAERALYGPQAAPPVIPEEVLRSARALHAELRAAPAVPAGAR